MKLNTNPFPDLIKCRSVRFSVLSLSLLDKDCFLLFVQPHWPFPASCAFEQFYMAPTKSTTDNETDKRLIKTKHHPLLISYLTFGPAWSSYFRSHKHVHICSLKQSSRYDFLLKAVISILFRYFKKSPILKSKSKWPGLLNMSSTLSTASNSIREYFHLVTEHKGWFNKWSSMGKKKVIFFQSFHL